MTMLRSRTALCVFAACVLAVTLFPWRATAQATNNESKSAEGSAPETSETIYLSNPSGASDFNEIVTALRNNYPHARFYALSGPYALTVRATAEDMQGAKKMIAELDRPKKIYRVTFSVSDVENGKRTATQHYSLVVTGGEKTRLRQGNRVPLVTGKTGGDSTAAQSSQIQYIDVGLNIEAKIEGATLETKVEQSAIGEEKSGVVAPDPVISQTMLEGTSALTAGKPVVLGSIDVPGTTRRQEIEVVTEPLAQ